MSLNGKVPPELKIQAVEDYIAVRKGSTQIKNNIKLPISRYIVGSKSIKSMGHSA